MKKTNTLKMIAGLLAIALSSTINNPVTGQSLSLDQCIREGIRNNPLVKNGLLSIQSSEYRIKSLKNSMLLPTIEGNGQYMYYTNLPVQYAPASAFGGASGEYVPLTLSMRQSTSANIQIRSILYDQSVFTGLKAARAEMQALQLETIVTQEDLVYNISNAYYNLQVIENNLVRLQTNIGNLKKTVEINSSLRDNDLVSESTHDRLLINLENLKNEYENEKLRQQRHQTLLKHLMNSSADATSLKVEDFAEESVIVDPATTDVAQRPDIQLQHARIELARRERKNIAAGYFPVFNSVATEGWNSYYNKFAPTKQINDSWLHSSSIGLTLKMPIFDGFKRQNELKQKDIAIQQQINTLSMMESGANKELEDAISSFESNKVLLASSKKNLELSEKLFNSTLQEYENGISSVTELLNAQNDFSDARRNYLVALLNIKLAELSLRKADGTLASLYL
jgi:outer membrane protein TolC